MGGPCRDVGAIQSREFVTPQVLLRVFTQDYTSKPIIPCDLSWESTPNLELKILSKCNPSWKSYLGLSCTHNGESCPNPNANPLWTIGALEVSMTKRL
jgi:hypothetical protein